MQTIIVPVDFTSRSRLAIDYLVDLYSTVPVRIVFLHAFSKSNTTEFLISIDDIIEKDLKSKLEKEGEKFQRQSSLKEIELVYLLEQNDIITAISNAVVKYSADLLVIGSDGEDSWSDVSLRDEGKTMNILRHIDIPALIIPAHLGSLKPKNVLFATLIDGIREENQIKPLVDLIKMSGAHLDVLSVGDLRESTEDMNLELKKAFNGYFKDLDFELHTLSEADTYSAINHFSESHQNDMVCIVYRKHGVLERLLKPSISKKVLSNVSRPILTLKQ